jgi:hypothetical protein
MQFYIGISYLISNFLYTIVLFFNFSGIPSLKPQLLYIISLKIQHPFVCVKLMGLFSFQNYMWKLLDDSTLLLGNQNGTKLGNQNGTKLKTFWRVILCQYGEFEPLQMWNYISCT